MPTAFTKRASDPEDVWRRVTGSLAFRVEANMPAGVPTLFVPAPDVVETITRPAPPQTAPGVLGSTSFNGRVLDVVVTELTGNPQPTPAQVTAALTLNGEAATLVPGAAGQWSHFFVSDNAPIVWTVTLTVATGVLPNGTWSASGILAPDLASIPLVLEPTGAPDHELRASGDGPFTVTIASPPEFAGVLRAEDVSEGSGTRLIEFNAAQIAPQCLVPPRMTRTSGTADEIGAVYTYEPGAWIYRESSIATDIVTWDVFRDGVALGLTNPATFTAAAAGVHEFRETFSGAGQVRIARSNLVGIAGALVPVTNIEPAPGGFNIVSLAPRGPALTITPAIGGFIIDRT